MNTNFEGLLAQVEAIKADAEKFFTKSNSAAGTRLRKGLQLIRKEAADLRKEITELKKAHKAS